MSIGINVNLAGEIIYQFSRAVGNATVVLIPAWSATGTYAVGDVVQYGGKAYQALSAQSGVAVMPVTAAEHWSEINLKGTRIWFGAPTANHTAGANTGNILIGNKSAGNVVGGITLEPDNYVGFDRPYSNPLDVYLTGFNASDSVEVQIVR